MNRSKTSAGSVKVLKGRANFAWLSATSRFTAASVAVAALGALAWTGCGSNANSMTCDDAGVCVQCDGYGCSTVGGPTIDASPDAGVTPGHDAGHDSGEKSDAKADSGEKSDAKADTGKSDAKTDAGSDVNTPPVCGGTNGPCACATSADCTDGNVCVAGACAPASSVCEYSSQCAGGDVCADGQCLPGCDATTPCAAGFTCTKSVCEPSASSTCTSDTDCTANAPYCVSGSCTLACSTSSQCPSGSGDYCDQGACVLDTSPSPDCSNNNDCDSGQVCQGGFCLYSCTTSAQCELIDARIGVCSDNVCRSAAEANPACTTQADCTAGQDCIGNICQ